MLDGLEIKEITLSDLYFENEEHRFDSEFVLKEYLEYDALISRQKFFRIGEFSKVTDGIHSSIDFDENSNINLISAKAPKKNTFNLEGTGYISYTQNKLNPRTQLKENDIIISTVGTIGNCAVVDKTILPANSDRHVGIIRVEKDSEYKPRFISTFLLSKYGRFQTKRHTTGNVQPNLFLYKIRDLKIPYISLNFQQRIEDIVVEATNLLQKSKEIYEEAEALLERELGFDSYIEPKEVYSVKNFSEVFGVSDRIDAEYYQEKYDRLESILHSYDSNCELLGNIVKYLFTGEYAEEYFNKDIDTRFFIRGTDIKNGYVEADDNYCIYPNQYTKFVKTGDIITGRVGTIGNFGVIDNSLDNSLCSDNILCFHLPERYTPEVYALYFNLPCVDEMITRLARGSVQQRLNQETLKMVEIPFIPEKKQLVMKAMVEESRSKQILAQELLNQAVHLVEIAIEQGEEEALKSLS